MREVKKSNSNTKVNTKNVKYQKKLKERFFTQVYPEFSSPVMYLRYKEIKAATAY